MVLRDSKFTGGALHIDIYILSIRVWCRENVVARLCYRRYRSTNNHMVLQVHLAVRHALLTLNFDVLALLLHHFF
jgi:hypothetical protein